jgi:hypothetical protein
MCHSLSLFPEPSSRLIAFHMEKHIKNFFLIYIKKILKYYREYKNIKAHCLENIAFIF